MAMLLEPDVIVMDFVLPKVDGISATEAIVQALPNTRVVGFTNHSESAVEDGFKNAGAIAVFQKDDVPRMAHYLLSVCRS